MRCLYPHKLRFHLLSVQNLTKIYFSAARKGQPLPILEVQTALFSTEFYLRYFSGDSMQKIGFLCSSWLKFHSPIHTSLCFVDPRLLLSDTSPIQWIPELSPSTTTQPSNSYVQQSVMNMIMMQQLYQQYAAMREDLRKSIVSVSNQLTVLWGPHQISNSILLPISIN